MIKTVLDGLMLLPDEIRGLALKNAIREGILRNPAYTIHESIMSFSWGGSPEGGSFWSKLHDKYLHEYNKTNINI